MKIEEIENSIDCYEVLRYLGIKPPEGKERIPCPIHNGDGNNFSITPDGKQWTCFSKGCGDGKPRGAVNLHCYIKYGDALVNLTSDQKKKALQELTSYAGGCK